MPSPFPSTAEQVVAAVEAVTVNARPTDAPFVAAFADMPVDRAETALALADELGLLRATAAGYVIVSPVVRFFAAGLQQRSAAALRIALESYEPFLEFRARLAYTTTASDAARHVKAKLQLTSHHDEIRDTLVSLGTYAQALNSVGGGQYELPEDEAVPSLAAIAGACQELAAAEAQVRHHIGERAVALASVPEVIQPLADALLRAGRGDPDGAVQQAGNAVEAYLVGVAARKSISLTGANGLNAKIERIAQSVSLPEKIKRVSKYSGDIRNAADHGPDPDIGNVSWTIRPNTGVEYVFVACSLLASLAEWEAAEPPSL
jgi:hypothetical protein